MTQQQPGIDPDDLATTLRVLASLHHLPGDHPDHVTVKRAASHMYKSIKAERKLQKRAAELAHDREVIERTATGSPMRIDDETAGIPLVSSAAGAFAGELLVARGCYICKQDFTLVDAFYHWLCPSCAAMSHTTRDQRTALTGKRALLTGGRATIGMYIALRLLRDGAHTTITTRFPKDAVRRFSSLPDSEDWIHRLKIVVWAPSRSRRRAMYIPIFARPPVSSARRPLRSVRASRRLWLSSAQAGQSWW